MLADAIAKKGSEYFFGFFIARSRSSQTHLGQFRFEPVSWDDIKTAVSTRGVKSNAFDYNSFRVRWLGEGA